MNMVNGVGFFDNACVKLKKRSNDHEHGQTFV